MNWDFSTSGLTLFFLAGTFFVTIALAGGLQAFGVNPGKPRPWARVAFLTLGLLLWFFPFRTFLSSATPLVSSTTNFYDIRLVSGQHEAKLVNGSRGFLLPLNTTGDANQLPEDVGVRFSLEDLRLPSDAEITAAWCVPAFNLDVLSQFERLTADWSPTYAQLSYRVFGNQTGKNSRGYRHEVRLYVQWRTRRSTRVPEPDAHP
jgi:hypothetical protein